MRKADPYLPTSPRMCVLGPPGGSRHLPLDSAGLRRVQLKPQPVPPRACCGHSPRLFGMPQAPARLTISPPLSPSLPKVLLDYCPVFRPYANGNCAEAAAGWERTSEERCEQFIRCNSLLKAAAGWERTSEERCEARRP